MPLFVTEPEIIPVPVIVAAALTVTGPEPVAEPVVLFTSSVPAVTEVPPEYVPDRSSSVPAPLLVNADPLEISRRSASTNDAAPPIVIV